MITETNEDYYETTGVRLDNVSQLKLFNVLYDDVNDERLLNIFKSYELSDDIVDNIYFELYEVENDDWWDNISYKFYGTPYLWWVVALYNGTTNPFEELNTGDSIYILKSQYIYQVLKEISSIGSV